VIPRGIVFHTFYIQHILRNYSKKLNGQIMIADRRLDQPDPGPDIPEPQTGKRGEP
jgi:hypothetical protein